MAKKKILVDYDFNQNEIQNPVFQNLASAPATPVTGQFYYDTGLKKLLIYDGSTWQDQDTTYTFSTGLTETGGTVTLNAATTSTLGGVIVGSNINVSSGTISVNSATNAVTGVIRLATDAEASTGTAEGIAVNPKQLATKITANAAITGATKCKITYDSKGLVTAGANLAESDIPSLHLSKITDVTATATEVNVLDGITASTTELNYVDGVTSAIQTQIDNKVTKNANITAGTATKITYDAKGLVTAGTSLSASDIPDISATYVPQTAVGTANGVASLGADGKVPSAQLPSFVDDVVDAYIVTGATPLSAGWLSATSGGTALTPETDKIYVIVEPGTQYTNKTYRWSGSTYVEISAAPGQATESTAGIAQIATQAEVNTGTNDTDIVTPLKLATYTSGMAKKFTAQNSALTQSGGVCTWAITNSLGTADVGVHVYEISTGDEVMCAVNVAAGTITIKINSTSNIAANTYKAVIIG